MLNRLRHVLQRRRKRDDALPSARGGSVLALSGLGDVGGMRSGRHGLERVDLALLGVVLALVLIGIVMVYSASIPLADKKPIEPTHFLVRHLIALGIAGIAAIAVFSVPMGVWQRFAPWVFAGGLALLGVVLLIGLIKKGAARWIPLGFFTLQPSELMKIACVLYAADFTVRKQDYMHELHKGFAPMAAVIALIGVLLMMQPDLGSLIVIVAITMGILFLGGLSGRLFVAISGVLAIAFVAVIWLSPPWRIQRIRAWIDPCGDEMMRTKGYQLCQSLIAFGRGEWAGQGLGRGVGKLNYLPEAHNDFIFAVIGEELGLAGVLIVALLFYWLVKRAFEIGRQAVALERTFAGLVAQGVGLWIGVQAFINMGVATGLLPTKGLTLPFVSFGGSALLATLIGVALLVRVDYENRALMRGGRA